MSDERALRDALEISQTSVRDLKLQLDALQRAKVASDDEELSRVQRDVERLQQQLEAERSRAVMLSRDADKAAQHLRELERERVTNEHLRAELIALRQAASRSRVVEAPAPAPEQQQDLERHAVANAQLQRELNALKSDFEQSTQVKELLRLQNEVTGLRNQLAREPSLRSGREAENDSPRATISPVASALVVAATLLFFSGELARFALGTESALVLLVAAGLAQFTGRTPPKR